jgi:hypothetical protein
LIKTTVTHVGWVTDTAFSEINATLTGGGGGNGGPTVTPPLNIGDVLVPGSLLDLA